MVLTGLSGLSGLSSVFGRTPAVPLASSVLVSGAGNAETDGTYPPRGTLNDRTYYNLEDEPDNPDASAILWDGANWLLLLSDGSVGYSSDLPLGVDAPNPWDVPEWFAIDGHDPAPAVTQV